MAIEPTQRMNNAGLKPDQMLDLYRHMVCTREVDNRLRTLYLQGKVNGGVYSQLGHEATSVGTAYALRATDIIAPMHRDLGAHIVRGMDIRRIFAQVMARASGYTAGKDNALHIGDLEARVLSPISMLGASIPVAAGAALAAKQRGDDAVALTYVGDGGINTADFHEGLNFAAALRLPFVLVIENNQYAYSTPVSRQVVLNTLAERSKGYGIPGVRVDGNDVVSVYSTTCQAVKRARAGEGPTLIECVTMRMRGHSENDDFHYVPAELLEEWSGRDPVDRFEHLLMDGSIMDSETRDRMRSHIASRVRDAAEWADAQPYPEPHTALEGVYFASEGQG